MVSSGSGARSAGPAGGHRAGMDGLDVRVMGWNIRAGGGRRIEGIRDQILDWRPDLMVLSEFRGTPPSVLLAASLADDGWPHQLTTAGSGGSEARENALLIASRWPLRAGRARAIPRGTRRWLLARASAPAAVGGGFVVGGLHAPNAVTGRKWPFLDAVQSVVRNWRREPGVIIGDTNTGRPLIDEQSRVFDRRHADWMEEMHARWPDAHRLHAGEQIPAYTWYSPNGGNGFRLDEAFLHPRLARRLTDLRHVWGGASPGGRRDVLSDHAALLVDLR